MTLYFFSYILMGPSDGPPCLRVRSRMLARFWDSSVPARKSVLGTGSLIDLLILNPNACIDGRHGWRMVLMQDNVTYGHLIWSEDLVRAIE